MKIFGIIKQFRLGLELKNPHAVRKESYLGTRTVQGRFKFRRTLKPTLCSLVYSDLTLEEVETFLPSFEEPSEASNKQNKTKRTEIAAFISRKINRSRVRIENPTLKHNCCGNYF